MNLVFSTLDELNIYLLGASGAQMPDLGIVNRNLRT